MIDCFPKKMFSLLLLPLPSILSGTLLEELQVHEPSAMGQSCASDVTCDEFKSQVMSADKCASNDSGLEDDISVLGER